MSPSTLQIPLPTKRNPRLGKRDSVGSLTPPASFAFDMFSSFQHNGSSPRDAVRPLILSRLYNALPEVVKERKEKERKEERARRLVETRESEKQRSRSRRGARRGSGGSGGGGRGGT